MLLPAAHQRLFEHLGVFVEGCMLPAARAVYADGVEDGLWELVESAMLEAAQVADATPHAPRFRMLETVREYALARLAESGAAEAARRCHAVYYLAFAEEVESRLSGVGQATGLDRLECERAKLRAALEWFDQAGDAPRLLRLGLALVPFWEVRGPLGEGRAWLERALAARALAPEARAAGLLGAAGWPSGRRISSRRRRCWRVRSSWPSRWAMATPARRR